MDVTLFKCNAIIFGRIVGGDASVAGQEFFVGFILGGGGRADGMAELSTYREVQKVYEPMADNEGEDLLSDLTRKLQ